jgi:ADP-ribose pyrophosphatase
MNVYQNPLFTKGRRMEYQILGKQQVFQGHAFDVELVTFRLPDGKERTYDLVNHRGSITLVPVDGQGQLLFVSQYRLGAGAPLLELPAGVLDPGEDPLEGAGRELREETGMAARQIQKLGEIYLAPGYSNEHMVIYLATGLYPDPLPADADEFLSMQAIPVREAYRMAAAGEIMDGKTLAALLLAQPHLQK